MSRERIKEILEYCLENGIFDRKILSRKGVLTSRSIQLQWLKICEISRRKGFRISPELDLTSQQYEFDDLENGGFQEEKQELNFKTPNYSERMWNDSEKSGENAHSLSKEKERKEKESAGDNNDYKNKQGNDSILLKRLFTEVEKNKIKLK